MGINIILKNNEEPKWKINDDGRKRSINNKDFFAYKPKWKQNEIVYEVKKNQKIEQKHVKDENNLKWRIIKKIMIIWKIENDKLVAIMVKNFFFTYKLKRVNK